MNEISLNLDDIEGVLPANQARSRDAQIRLMRAGEAVFAELGYDAARVNDIAAAAGCSIGSFYRRFQDKEALFRALQTQFALRGRENIDRFFAMPAWTTAPVAEVLRTLVLNTARQIERHPGFFRALFQRSLEGVGAPYFVALADGDVHAARKLAAFLQSRDAAPQGDIDALCKFAVQSMEAVLVQKMLHGGSRISITEPALIDQLTRLMTNYLELPRTP
ncbi:MAG: TetR/AcrR family transcriptional regulator [Phenylobacterium sp.]|nr:TetR/AcrR family transcriptional regulator [Phenylobacterium sp.]